MKLIGILSRIVRHPFNKHTRLNSRLNSALKFLAWQIGTRILPHYSIVVNFVETSRLIVCRGMAGATGNIYTGLYEFEDMTFVLHFLRKFDSFIDIGANVGVYTVLAGKVVGAKCLSVEPVPKTFALLMDNLRINGIDTTTAAVNIGLGNQNTEVNFTSSLDATNHVVLVDDGLQDLVKIPIRKLNIIAQDFEPTLIKIDVEGYECEVLTGGDEIFLTKSLQAVIIELNESGNRYGNDDNSIHELMLKYGFEPYEYKPFSREIVVLDILNRRSQGNIIYIRDIEFALNRVESARQFKVNNIFL